MNNIDNAYKNWFENGRSEFEKFADPMFYADDALGKEKFHKISKDWFVEKIKTDDEFAKKWDIQVNTRKLSNKERQLLVSQIPNITPPSDLTEKEWIVTDNIPYKIPTKVISITYNNEITEIYE